MSMKRIKYIVQDWAGNVMFNGGEFDTFDDAWDAIRSAFPNEEDWQEFEVIPKAGRVEEARFLDPKAPRALRHRE